MKIEGYSIDMSGKSTYLEARSEKQSLKLWTGNRRTNFENEKLVVNNAQNSRPDNIIISEDGRKLLKEIEISNKDDSSEFTLSEEDKLKIDLIEGFIKTLTGKKIKIRIPEKFKLRDDNLSFKIKLDNANQNLNRHGWGLEYKLEQKYYESETMTFESKGTVKAADGRELKFSIGLGMKRKFMSQETLSIIAGDAKIDPLVINFDNIALDMTDNKINFDLNSDGQDEQISFVSKGSGFLALDLNGDGIINNGKELFGPQTGNGFSELSNYDSDKNNWIDENDAVFNNLKIWIKDKEGKDTLFTLDDKGIGALYLGSINTTFSIKDTENNLLGQIQRTGIFLNENGTAGALQHIDIAI